MTAEHLNGGAIERDGGELEREGLYIGMAPWEHYFLTLAM